MMAAQTVGASQAAAGVDMNTVIASATSPGLPINGVDAFARPGDHSPMAQSPFKVTPWWPQAPAPLRKPYLVEAVMALVALAMLLAFFQVVDHAVLQGDQLRRSVAAHSAATYQCKSLVATGSGDACLRELNAPATAGGLRPTSLLSVAAR
jgi:hypothetical protein